MNRVKVLTPKTPYFSLIVFCITLQIIQIVANVTLGYTPVRFAIEICILMDTSDGVEWEGSVRPQTEAGFYTGLLKNYSKVIIHFFCQLVSYIIYVIFSTILIIPEVLKRLLRVRIGARFAVLRVEAALR